MRASDSVAGARDEGAALLIRFVAGEPEAFVAFYRLNLSAVVAFFLWWTGDREVSADLTAEVFAAALMAAPRYDPDVRPALAWLHGIASHKLADSRRRGRVEDEARLRLALEPLVLNDQALDRVEEMASSHAGRDALDGLMLQRCPSSSAKRCSPVSWASALTQRSPRRWRARRWSSDSGSAAA